MDANRNIPDFAAFYAQLDPGRLATLYQEITHPMLTKLFSQCEEEDPKPSGVLRDLIKQMPQISFDIAAVATMHVLHEYHQWFVESLSGTGDGGP